MNYRLWVVICLCRFTGYNQRTILVEDVDSEGVSTYVEARALYRTSLYFLLSVAVNLKLLWKGMSIFKNYVCNLVYTPPFKR